MSGMDSFLAEMYGTNKTASAEEDLEKAASIDLFVKLAGEQNIDLANMPEQQVQALYDGWVEKSAQAQNSVKTAGEDDKDDKKDDGEKKREEAEKEHEEKKAASEKLAEADFLGRVMAHAYAQELRKIAASQNGETEEPAEGEKEAAMPPQLAAALGKAKGHVGAAANKVKEHAGNAAQKLNKNRAGIAVKNHLVEHKGAYTAGGAAAAGGAAGAAAAHHHHKSKKASAIDELAAQHAVQMAHDNGFDTDEAGRKVAAVLELVDRLGIAESEKVASAPTVDDAVGIRALEFLEAAGYPVTWNQ